MYNSNMQNRSKTYWINLLTLFFKFSFWGLLIALTLFWALRSGWEDFRGYYSAAMVVVRGGNPYDYSQIAAVLEEVIGSPSNNPYFYPPWFSLLFVPFTLLSYPAARTLWFIINGALFYVSLELLYKGMQWQLASWKRWALYALSILAFASYSQRFGQAGIFVFFGLALALYAVRREILWLAGLGLIVAVTKPQATLLVVLALGIWLLLHQSKAAVWGVGWGVGLLLLSSLLIPRWWHFEWDGFGQGLSYTMSGPDQVGSERVLSTAQDFSRYVLGLPLVYQYVFWVCMGLLSACLVVYTLRKLPGVLPLVSVSTLFMLAITPYALQYDYVHLAIPVFWMLQQLPRVEVKYRYGVIGLLLFAFSVYFWQTWSYEGYWQVIAVLLAFVLLLVGMRSTRKMEAVSD
ncbi:MAG: DUF2029 domain-containing protein [Anaerolineales bacterium]|nr:DUF2029 domain-containing protein [Anaerolineales bacterium]